MIKLFRPLMPCLLLAALHTPGHAAEPRNIGTAVEIRNSVTAAQTDEDKRRLAKQDPVREREVLESAVNSRGEFVLADDTKLVLGPTARLVLDEFVYDPGQRAGNKVTVNFVKGAFRFISGGSGQQAYEIRTPLASLGIRGTKIDGYVADDGRMALLLHQDVAETTEVEVCSTVTVQRSCQRLRSRCHLVYVTPSGAVTPQRATWDGAMLPGVGVQTAFPFLETRLAVDPVIQCRYADLFTRQPILRKALAPAPIPGPAPPPPAPAPLPIALIATTIAVPLVLMEVVDNDPASP
ncbi:MAG: FecR domain-containing protein [Hyphomicrobiaceae bacterium]|nr:FecR domain-containing protein [Hyphomicrobiaceae bacterium]